MTDIAREAAERIVAKTDFVNNVARCVGECYAKDAHAVARAYLSLLAEHRTLSDALEQIRMILLPHKHTNYLSSDGKKIYEIIQATLRQSVKK